MKTKTWRLLAVTLAVLISTACSLLPSATPTESVAEPSPTEEYEDIGPLDCQQDMDCFIQAAQECLESNVAFVFPLDFMGVLITTTSALTIEGMEMEECVFHILTDDVEISYSDDGVQQMKDSGMSEADIEAQRLQMQDGNLEAGYDDTCRGRADDLVTLLLNWQMGSISTEDLDPFSCEGKITSDQPTEIVVELDDPVTPTVEVDDGNLIANASFEQDQALTVTMWSVETRGTDLSAQWSSDQSNLGDHSLELIASTAGNQGWPGWFTTDLIPIEQGMQYVFRVWANTPDGADAWVSIGLYDASGQSSTAVSSGCVDFPVDTWSSTLVSLLPHRTEGITHVRLGMHQCLTSTAGDITHLFYDDAFFGLLEDLPQ